MWIFTRYGFFSISVQNGKTVVRARLKRHLQNLAERFPTHVEIASIVTTPEADYRYRLTLSKEVWAEINGVLAEEQDWSNFKNEATRFNGHDDYVRCLHEVWGVMFDSQQRAERSSASKNSGRL